MAVPADVLRILGTPGSHYDMIQEGPFATVARTWVTIKQGQPQWVVVKSASFNNKFAREPHDIVKELRLLASIVHPNIVNTIGSFKDEQQMQLNIYLPHLPISLSDLLASPYFSPYPFPPQSPEEEHAARLSEERFDLITRSIMLQTLSAIAYLHHPQRRIAHRDLKPENILITRDGCVKLIDFGVAFKDSEPDTDKVRDMWPEYRTKLYFEVSTRAYRAPELLFGTRTYDPVAIDLWSLGATFAEFFTPLRLSSDDTDDGDDDDDTAEDEEEDERPLQPFIVPKYLRVGYPGAQWTRDSLFNGERGEIGLAWSIFKVFGTPNSENWPEFDELPGAKSVVFNVVSSVPLGPLLPNLPKSTGPSDTLNTKDTTSSAPTTSPSESSSPSSSSSSPPSCPTTSLALDLLVHFLRYPSSARLSASEALNHPLFTTPSRSVDARQAVVLLPRGYSLDHNGGNSLGYNEQIKKAVRYEWNGRALGEWLEGLLGQGRE